MAKPKPIPLVLVVNLGSKTLILFSSVIPEPLSSTVIFIKSSLENTVEDNGSGITEENKIKVFEPKFTTKTSGMGLGLAMVKNIVETYKGRITFTSEYGKGTIFTVAFPKQ